MIDWLNQNAGAFTALLMLVYVVATLLIVGIMIWANFLTRRNIQTTLQLERERYRPTILVDMVPLIFSPHLIVKNTGLTPAYDIKFRIVPNPMSFRGVSTDKTNPNNRWVDIPFLDSGIAFLAAGREVQAFMASFRELNQKYESLHFSGEVTYRNREGTTYSELINIDLGFHEGIARYHPKEIGAELEKIHKAIDKFFSFQFRPLIRTIDDAEYQRRERRQVEKARKLRDEMGKLENVQQTVEGDSEIRADEQRGQT